MTELLAAQGRRLFAEELLERMWDETADPGSVAPVSACPLRTGSRTSAPVERPSAQPTMTMATFQSDGTAS